MNTVKYFKKVSDTNYSPFAISKKSMMRNLNSDEHWCNECKAVVNSELKVNNQGMLTICPWCLTEKKEIKNKIACY